MINDRTSDYMVIFILILMDLMAVWLDFSLFYL